MSKLGYIQRYMLIIRLIRNNRYISLPELIRKVEDGLVYFDDTEDIGISRRTILRDLKFMHGKNCPHSFFRKDESPVVQSTCLR